MCPRVFDVSSESEVNTLFFSPESSLSCVTVGVYPTLLNNTENRMETSYASGEAHEDACSVHSELFHQRQALISQIPVDANICCRGL